MKFVLTQALRPEALELLPGDAELFVADDPNPHNYLEQLADADALVVRIAAMDAKSVAASPRLRVIGRTGVGYDSVDVAAATAAGIPVVLTPGANNRSVAEHTVAMVLALSKNLVECHNETVAGRFIEARGSGRAFEILGKSIGFVGLGAIGAEAARLCRALGMEVYCFDPFLPESRALELGCTPIPSLEALLPRCDFVSLHLPLTDSTKNLISMPQLRRMKPSAALINCARGGIVDEADLVEALEKGVIAAAAVDVFAAEPPAPDDPLLHVRNMILSPHSAAQTREAVLNMHRMCVKGCLAVLSGERYPHVADPAVYHHPRWRRQPPFSDRANS